MTQSSEKVEAVAEALRNELLNGKRHKYLAAWMGASDPSTCFGVDGEIDLVALAKAAIEAMREPSEAMEDAGMKAMYDCYSPEPGDGFDEDPAKPIFTAMINKALEE